MSIPNIQQQLYLKKALNENTDGMFDHPTLDEGSYVHSKKQLKKAIKGSKREIVKAMKRGNKKDAEFWMQNKKDAESQMSESIAEALLRRYIELTEGVQRMRRLRRAHASGKASREITAAYDKELAKVSASRLRRGGAPKQTVRAFFTDKPTTKAADKAYSKFAKDAMGKASAKGKKIF